MENECPSLINQGSGMLEAAAWPMSSVLVYGLNPGVTRCNFNSLLAHNAPQHKGVTLSRPGGRSLSIKCSLTSLYYSHYSPSNSPVHVPMCPGMYRPAIMSSGSFFPHVSALASA